MKQVTYRIRGMVEDGNVPSIMAAVAAVPGVRRVQLSPTEEMDTLLILHMMTEPMDAQEEALSAALEKHGVAVILDTRTVTDLEEPKPRAKQPKTVTLPSAIAAMAVVVAVAVLLTFALTTGYLRRDVPPAAEETPTVFDEMELLDRLFRDLTVKELDEDFETNLLKAYVAATGDTYAEYFTAEELAAMNDEQDGKMCGVGMQVVSDICTVGGVDYQAIVVTNVYKDSPAEAAGVLPGDSILYVGIGEDRVLIHEIGYTEALNRMSGEEGTACTFTVLRYNAETEAYDEVEISAIRQMLTTHSVTGRVYSLDASVGVVKITGFDNTTAAQFEATVEELKVAGCTSFVLDLRGNPGGLLTSVLDVLTYFLEDGDTMITARDNSNSETVYKLTLKDGTLSNCNPYTELDASDVGKYRDLHFAVLVNGYSASAAELFTANMRDYDLATVVGDTTFGKGSMQSTLSLKNYGYEGALKLTTAYYYPPSGNGYDGVGITPDVPVALDEAVQNININLLTDEQDNQLAAAVDALK